MVSNVSLPIRKLILQLSEICHQMPVKSFGPVTCSKRSQDPSTCSLKTSSIQMKSKDTTVLTTPWENNWLFTKCGITNHGAMKLKRVKPPFRLLLSSDTKKTRNCMLTLIWKLCNWSEKPNVWIVSESKFLSLPELFFFKKINSKLIIMNYCLYWKNTKESSAKSSLLWKHY